jgi:hypothetical protein
MYDLIGDIHGHAGKLKQLLEKMDYKEREGVWQHAERKAIFVGDYIDRGPAIRETLQIVKAMSDHGHAIALMGNHEYNALAYAYPLEDGSFLRAHNEKNDEQHRETLEQFKDHPAEWKTYLEWFYSLKLYLDLPELRAVHACWDQEHIDWLKEKGLETMTPDFMVASHKKGTKEYEVINDILKGKEFTIPEEFAWKDKDGHSRHENRIKWWKQPKGIAFGEFLFNCPDHLEQTMIEEEIEAIIYDKDAPPVFFGHYWLEDHFPVVQAANVVCLDYSVAKEGYLVGYRWEGEKVVRSEGFVKAGERCV